MPLVDLPTPDTPLGAMPENIRSFILDADQRADRFIEERADRPVPGFVPSDFSAAWIALHTVRTQHLAPGNALCEWGSGIGAVAIIASMLGYQASGIEINEELVAEADRLARDYRQHVRFACGSFLPPGAERFADDSDGPVWLLTGGPDGHDDLGLDPDDFDVIFAYPWPGEEGAIHRCFLRYAAAGALLVTYNGVEGLRLQRKVRGR